MTTESRHLEHLTAADCEKHSVWRFARGQSGDETCLRPAARIAVSDLRGELVATRVTLASGPKPWALIGNIDLANPRLTKHFVTVSIEHGGRWFHLARYHDFDYAERGPEQLARFLGLRVEEVFPIAYDVSASVQGEKAAAIGRILTEPDERLSRAEIIALEVP